MCYGICDNMPVVCDLCFNLNQMEEQLKIYKLLSFKL